MKKILTMTLCLMAAVCAMAQGRVETRSYILGDFPDKVTKVVLPQDPILQSALKQEVVNVWNASAFEFCSEEEFDALKGGDNYYFLTVQAFKFKGEQEPGILFLSLLKGESHEVISLPLAPMEDSSGRELTYIGALVKAIQDYTLAAMESEATAYVPDKWFNACSSRGMTGAKWVPSVQPKTVRTPFSVRISATSLVCAAMSFRCGFFPSASLRPRERYTAFRPGISVCARSHCGKPGYQNEPEIAAMRLKTLLRVVAQTANRPARDTPSNQRSSGTMPRSCSMPGIVSFSSWCK